MMKGWVLMNGITFLMTFVGVLPTAVAGRAGAAGATLPLSMSSGN